MYEITVVIPRYYNDGTRIPSSKIKKINAEFNTVFGGCSRQPIEGQWIKDGQTFKDRNWRYWLTTDTDDEEWLDQYLHTLKERLKIMLDQLDIHIAVSEVRVI